MIDLINNWLQSIVIAVIIVTIIEILVPNGKNKKYIKVVIGVYILLVIISPIINKVSVEKFNIEEIISTKEYKDLTEELTENTNKNVEKIYEENLKSEIKQKIEEQGYIVNDVFITVNKTEKEYGKVEYIKIIITKDKKTVTAIKQININLNKQQTYENEINDNEEAEQIKNFIIENYEIDKDKIYIQVNIEN